MLTELLVDAQAHFIADGFYFGGIHSEALGGKGVETAGSFGAEFVAKDVLALFEQPDEENHLLVAQFEVGTEAARPPSAAAQFHRLAAGGLHVFEREIIVRVLRRELEDDFDFIAARDCVTVSEQDTIVKVAQFSPARDAGGPDFAGRVAGANEIADKPRLHDLFRLWPQLEILAFNQNFVAGAFHVFLFGEIAEVGRVVEGTLAVFGESDLMRTRPELEAVEQELVVEGEEVLLG